MLQELAKHSTLFRQVAFFLKDLDMDVWFCLSERTITTLKQCI